MKTCIKCNREFPSTSEYFFYRNAQRGWLSSWCKECKTLHRKENLDKELLMQRIRRRQKNKCNSCNCSVGFRKKYCDSCRIFLKASQKKRDKAIYKKRLRRSMPKWANRFFIKEIYELARMRTELTGVSYSVDHIIPIRGKKVCGLHTHENLRIIPYRDNAIKNNHFSLEHEGRR